MPKLISRTTHVTLASVCAHNYFDKRRAYTRTNVLWGSVWNNICIYVQVCVKRGFTIWLLHRGSESSLELHIWQKDNHIEKIHLLAGRLYICTRMYCIKDVIFYFFFFGEICFPRRNKVDLIQYSPKIYFKKFHVSLVIWHVSSKVACINNLKFSS